jgi:hypothetical protein
MIDSRTKVKNGDKTMAILEFEEVLQLIYRRSCRK